MMSSISASVRSIRKQRMEEINDQNEAASLLLFEGVKWAKKLPGFSELPSCDQIVLLEESWNEMFLMFAIEHGLPTMPPSSPLFQFNKIGNFSDTEACNTSNNGDREADFSYIENLIGWFQDLELESVEIDFFKAVVLYKPDTYGLKGSSQVQSLLDQVLLKASEHYQKGKNQNRLARFYKLLLSLPFLLSVPAMRLQQIYFDSTNMGKLLFDMLVITGSEN